MCRERLGFHLGARGGASQSVTVGSLWHMYLEEVIQGRSLLVEGIAFRRLCNCLTELSGLTFTAKPRFFWSALGVRAEFVFHGQAFKIEAVDVNRSFLIS